MESQPKPKVKVYYDGLCNLCAGLADNLDTTGKGTFQLTDITPGALPDGVTKEEALHDIHVIDDTGKMYRGADAVMRVLQEYPRLRWIAKLGSLPGLHLIARGLYRIVEQTRYWIFGRKVV